MKTLSDKEQEAQTICTTCGLCCNGTLFKCANLIATDSDENLNKAGIVTVQNTKKRCFRLPCHHLHNRHCKIYHLWRPAICASFRCKVLLRLFAGELSFEQGIEIVIKTLKHVDEFLKQTNDPNATDMLNLQDRFTAWEKNQVVPNISVQLNYAALRFRLDRDFIINKNDSIPHHDK